jgi:hypothetical protein
MFEIRTHKSIGVGATFIANIDDSDVEITWKDDHLIADGDPRHILHTWIEDGNRVFSCAGTPECPECELTTECEHCDAPDKNGVYPAEFGLHRIKHAIEGSATCIPCRKGDVKTAIGRYAWTDNFQKTSPATQML